MRKYTLIICFLIISILSFSIVPIVINKNTNQIKTQDKNLISKNNINKTRIDKIIDGICNSAGTLIIAILNLGILISQLKKNRKKEKENLENEKKSYWYRKIILEKNIEYLFDFFKESHEIYLKNNRETLSDEEYSEIRNQYFIIRTQYYRLITLLSSIFKETQITNTLHSKMLEHENLVFADDITEPIFMTENKRLESETIELLYNYDFQNYKMM